MRNSQPWNQHATSGFISYVSIISLIDAQQRRNKLQVNGFPNHWVESYWAANDKRQYSKDDLVNDISYQKLKQIYKRGIHAGEIGCLNSHLDIYNWFANQNNHDLMVVFEDDIIPSTKESFQQLDEILEFFNDRAKSGEAFICHLGAKESQCKHTYAVKVKTKNNIPVYKHIDKKFGLWLSHAYVISKKAAEKYHDNRHQHYFFADDWNRIKNILNINIYYTQPCLFVQNEDETSSIDPNNKRKESILITGKHTNNFSLINLYERFYRKLVFHYRKHSIRIVKKISVK